MIEWNYLFKRKSLYKLAMKISNFGSCWSSGTKRDWNDPWIGDRIGSNLGKIGSNRWIIEYVKTIYRHKAKTI